MLVHEKRITSLYIIAFMHYDFGRNADKPVRNKSIFTRHDRL